MQAQQTIAITEQLGAGMEVENAYGVGTPPPTQAGGPALRDMSNQPASGPCERAAKRPRLSSSRLEQLDALVRITCERCTGAVLDDVTAL